MDIHNEASAHRRVRRRIVAAVIGLLLSIAAATGGAAALVDVGPALRSTSTVPTPIALQEDHRMNIPEDVSQGAARLVNRELVQKTAVYFACIGIYLIVALIFFIYWRWMRRDLPILSVSLLSGIMAVHTAAISGSLSYLLPSLFSPQLSMTVETVSYLLLNGFIAFMLWAFFPESFRPFREDWMRALNTTIATAAVLASVVFAVIAVFSTAAAASLILFVSRWITVVLMVVVAALALKALENRQLYGTVTAIGLALLIVGSVHDVLFASFEEGGRPYLITFAFLGFVLLQSYVVMRRSAESTEIAQSSSKRLLMEVEARTKELRAATVAAQAANMAKTEYVTSVTHELRTPLTSMLGYIQLLRDELQDELEEEQMEFIDVLESSGDRLLNLVNNLLDLARLESGRVEMKLRPVDVKNVVEEVRSELYPIANQKRLYLRTTFEATESIVLADEQWLNLVLANLVSNAVKYTRAGGVEVRVASAHMGRKDAVAVKVVDTGPGISSEFMPRLFERFARDEHAREDAPTGSGLGLTIARELLHLMGGEIFVESKLSEGSTFTVLLPVPEPGPEPEEQA